MSAETSKLPPPLPPMLPVIALDYYRAAPPAPAAWKMVARCPNTGQWHELRRALTAANITTMMGGGKEIEPGDQSADSLGIELLVRGEDLARAHSVLDAYRNGLEFCPACGSTNVRRLPAAWYWYLLAIIFLGLSPFWPPSRSCEACGKEWG